MVRCVSGGGKRSRVLADSVSLISIATFIPALPSGFDPVLQALIIKFHDAKYRSTVQNS
jgi:hypothetical protein